MTDAPRQLEYAPPVAWHQRRSLHKWLIVLACLATLASSYWWAPPALQHAQLLYWQRQCMNYTADPGQVVWSSDGAAVVPDVWVEFDAANPDGGRITSAVLFLGGLKDASGRRRLIAVQMAAQFGVGAAVTNGELPPIERWMVTWTMDIYEPGSLLRRPRRISARTISNINYFDSLTVYAGQRDPDNPSHFTIEIEIDGERGVIDGWVRDEEVLLERRPEWTTPPPRRKLVCFSGAAYSGGANMSRQISLEVLQAEIPLERDLFLRTLIRELAGTLQDVVGLDEASGFISVVGQNIGDQINSAYRNALNVPALSRQQVADVLLDLKRRINGQFYIVEESDEKIVFGNRACPFEEKVVGRPSMCMMTSNVFGAIAAENLGYSKVELQQTIARGDSECRVVVHLKQTPQSEAANGREYFKG